MRLAKFVLLLVCTSTVMAALQPALCWSNGGYSANPAHPDYGTHDWIAQHALDYLPAQEKQYIVNNLASYLYGTELPDQPASQGGIGDASVNHHIYFFKNSTLQDDSAAQRAREEYQKALTYLKSGDYVNAAKEAGVMSHYIDDMGVFGHVMGVKTDWSAEDSSKHSSYETYVDARTGAYVSSSFDSYLRFDGSLATVSAYDAAKDLAYNTTFGDNGAYTCTWVNSNYDWSNPAFKNRCGEEMNLATNAVADVLHVLYVEALPTSTVSPTATPTVSPTPTTTLTPSPTPTTPGTPSPTPTPTEMYTSTPTTKTGPTAIPTVPEFPITFILVGAMLTILLIAFICLKTQKTR